MADKGIIFSAAMVRALHDGRKAQTRRLMPQQEALRTAYSPIFSERERAIFTYDGEELISRAPYAPGDRLYVREACFATELADEDGRDGVIFLADDEFVPIANTVEAGIRWLKLFHYGQKKGEGPDGMRGKSVPSIHMPRWASRLTLLVTDVRVQRVAEISTADCYAEGAISEEWLEWREDVSNIGKPPGSTIESERDVFRNLWDSLHTKPGERWEDNPWIVAVTFEVKRGNIDRSEA